MAITVQARMSGLPALRARADLARRELPEDARRTLQTALGAIRDDARRAAPRDTGALRRSIVYRTEQRADVLVGMVGTPLPYAIVVERGRRAGARMPPPLALAGWAARHGFLPTRGNLFVLARAIGRRGQRGRPFLGPALRRNRPLLAAAFGRVLRRAALRLVGRPAVGGGA